MTKPDKTKLNRTVILVFMILFTLAFIFSNSFESQEVSNAKSTALTEFFNRIFGAETLENPIIRKLAHIMEFTLLGAEFMLFAAVRRMNFTVPLLSGLLCALTDETIQMFTGRGSLVSDVWIDFCGVCIGMLIVNCFLRVFRRKQNLHKIST